MRVSAVFRPYDHHARWSGYPRFVERLTDAREIRPLRLPRRGLERLARRNDHPWVGPDQLQTDLAAALRMVAGRGEIVHMLYGESDLYNAGRFRLRGNRLVATFHQPPRLVDHLVPTDAVLDRLDHAIALGPRAAEHLASRMGAERVSQALHGTDTDAWRPGVRAAEPTCAFVGSWLRDFGVLTEVIRIVKAAEPRVRFEAITTGDVPGARTGIGDEELRCVYQRAWVHVMPLEDAVANNALLEGMACGVPSVVTDVGDVSAYTGDGAARLVPPGDAEAMAAAVLELVGDREGRERMGRAARARAQGFGLDAVARRHAQIYERVGCAR